MRFAHYTHLRNCNIILFNKRIQLNAIMLPSLELITPLGATVGNSRVGIFIP